MESAQQGKTTVQVVPYRAGAHAGTTGPFVILDFPEPTDPAVVYVETLAGDIYLEERSDVNRSTLAFDRLRAASLHPDESVQLIERLANTLRWGQCVAVLGMTEIDLSRAEWRKSSYSSQSGNCVEVARNLPDLVAVRDSNQPDGAKLVVSRETWRAFLLALRA